MTPGLDYFFSMSHPAIYGTHTRACASAPWSSWCGSPLLRNLRRPFTGWQFGFLAVRLRVNTCAHLIAKLLRCHFVSLSVRHVFNIDNFTSIKYGFSAQLRGQNHLSLAHPSVQSVVP